MATGLSECSTPAQSIYQQACREMTIRSGPGSIEDHLRGLQANGAQTHLMLADVGQFEAIERLIRRNRPFGLRPILPIRALTASRRLAI
jgi:hypothetical protein